MARTYRRLKFRLVDFNSPFCGYWWYVTEDYGDFVKLYSDKTTNCKEPGPSWFKRKTYTVPNRRFNKLELHRFMLDTNHEVMSNIEIKDKEYWT